MKILVINAGSSSLKYQLFDMDTALVRGTIFAELDLPFAGCRGCGGVKNG